MSEKEALQQKSVTGHGKKLSDDELNGVSGGLFDITIIDTCQKKYDYNHCCYNFGKCPQLDVMGEYVEFVNGRKVRHFTCSCNKGYFFGITDTRNS
ncbi:MAG: hypothetical protein ABFD25_15105 [Clostridiaceae bacterium]